MNKEPQKYTITVVIHSYKHSIAYQLRYIAEQIECSKDKDELFGRGSGDDLSYDWEMNKSEW